MRATPWRIDSKSRDAKTRDSSGNAASASCAPPKVKDNLPSGRAAMATIGQTLPPAGVYWKLEQFSGGVKILDVYNISDLDFPSAATVKPSIKFQSYKFNS